MKFFQNFSLRKLLFNKKIAVSLSLIVAFIFWLIITLDQNPERERSFGSIPITVSTQGTILAEQGIDVINKDMLLKSASVTVSGPNYIVSSLKADDIKIYADLSGVSKPGSYTISLSAVKNTVKTGFSIVQVNPSNIQVEFDYFDTQKFDLTARVDGVTTLQGLISDSAKVTNDDEQTIEIRGPRAEIEKIGSVVAYYKGDEVLDNTETFEGSIIIYDTNGKVLDNSIFELPYETVDISVPVYKERVLKLVPTFSGIGNDKLADYIIGNNLVKLSTKQVTVYGQPEKIDSLTAIELAPIDMNSVSKKNNVIKDVSILLQDGVKLRDDVDNITVTFDLADFAQKEILVSNFDYGDSLANGISAKFESKKILICGPESIVSKINSSVQKKFKLKVDLQGKTVSGGSTQVYNVPYTVVYPENILAWEIFDSDGHKVQVSLTQK